MTVVYNRRDRIGHWVNTEQPANRHCHHACCRGYREHPDNWPMIPLKRQLRGATDEKLAKHYDKAAADPTPQGRGAELQIIAELERRDRAEVARIERDRRRQQRRESVADNRAARRLEVESERERIRVDAEAQTRGYLVNAKGRARGIDPEEILTGRQQVFERYASDEARDYFAVTPRPTAAYFRGLNTRAVPRSSYR
jgi:hypothetical protein